MNEEEKNQIRILLKKAIEQIKDIIYEIYPNLRVKQNWEDEFLEKIVTAIDYADNAKNLDLINMNEVLVKIFEILGTKYDLEELAKIINQWSLNNLLDFEKTDCHNDTLILINNLVEGAHIRNRKEDLRKLFFDPDISENLSLIQFLSSNENCGIQNFLFKKPFRFSSANVQRLIQYYLLFSGFFETFTKLIFFSYKIILEDKIITKKDFEMISKKRFSEILEETNNNYEFRNLSKYYKRILRNKLTHKNYRISNKEKLIKYSRELISFKDLLADTRNLFIIVNNVGFVNIFLMRKEMEENYLKFCNLEKIVIKKSG